MTDIPGNSSTTASLTVGGSTTGTLEVVGDHDWFRIELVAGQTVTVALNGFGASAVNDPYLRIRDASGNVIFENDDSGQGLNSRVSFSAPTTGVYYIDVGSWEDRDVGTYQVSVALFVPPPVGTNDQIADQLVNGYWEGASRHFNVAPGGSLSVNLSALTAEGQNLARNALALWTDVIGVNFVEVASGGQISFDDNEDGAHAESSSSGGIISSAHVNVSTKWLTDHGTSLNSYAFQTYVHEIGHALGLGHAGGYNGSASYPYDARFSNDSWAVSVMSYFDQRESTYYGNQGFTKSYALTPMVADIIAMGRIYGLSTTTRAGDTVYGFNSTADRALFDATKFTNIAYTIYDSAGIDTLDYSGFSAAQLINLNPETFSNVGGLVGNVSIARTVVIENALGGSGADQIFGNGANNSITGGAGADVLHGGLGNDILSADRHHGFDNGTAIDQLFGGAGNDMIFSGYGDIVDGGDGFDTVGLSYLGATHGIDGDTRILHTGQPLVAGGGTFRSIERFSDITLTMLNDRMVIGDQDDPAVVRSWDGDDHLIGQDMSITMYGGNGNDLLVGGRADDVIYGENGDDRILGFLGADELWGGAGADTFYFAIEGATDRVRDFERGIDKLDVTGADANTSLEDDQAFTFIGSAAFSGTAGELRVYSANNEYFVAGDVNGDGVADLLINLGAVQVGSEDIFL